MALFHKTLSDAEKAYAKGNFREGRNILRAFMGEERGIGSNIVQIMELKDEVIALLKPLILESYTTEYIAEQNPIKRIREANKLVREIVKKAESLAKEEKNFI